MKVVELIETIDSLFRYMLSPFVMVGWVLAKYGMWTPFGLAAVGMAIIGGLGIGTIALVMFTQRVIPGIIQLPFGIVVFLCMIVGIIRGALFSMDNKNSHETMDLHFIEPIKFKVIFEGLIVFFVLGIILYLFLKLLTGR